MKTITVNMIDLLTDNQDEVVRTIDISNIQVPNYDAPIGWECDKIETDKEKQIKLIEKWIDDRANNQHETILELVSFTIN